MKWTFEKEHCFCLSHGQFDLLGEILEMAHDATKKGLIDLSPSELVDFEALCDQADLSLHPLGQEDIAPLRRIK